MSFVHRLEELTQYEVILDEIGAIILLPCNWRYASKKKVFGY
jgi:hypothetical protein